MLSLPSLNEYYNNKTILFYVLTKTNDYKFTLYILKYWHNFGNGYKKLTTMKTKRILFILSTSLLIGLFSCELLDDATGLTVAERLEGRWLCEEDNPFKSAQDFYRVYIDINPIDSNTIEIDNFLGVDLGAVHATISGMTINLPNQSLQGEFQVYGTGTISNNYKTITWHYFVDDGSGIWSEVNSVYTKEDY